MSRKQRRENILFLFVLTVYFYSFRVCHSVSLGQREDGLERIKQDDGVQLGTWRLVEQIIQDTNLNKPTELRPESAAFSREPLPYFSDPILGETDFALDSLPWTRGDGRRPRSSASDSPNGYQADFPGETYLKRNSPDFTHQSLFPGALNVV